MAHQRIRKTPSYLSLRDSTYHFRYAIPRQYQLHLTGEIHLSLKTGNIKIARARAARLAELTERYLMTLEGKDVTVSKSELKAALGRLLRDELDAREAVRAKRFAEDSQYNEFFDWVAAGGSDRANPIPGNPSQAVDTFAKAVEKGRADRMDDIKGQLRGSRIARHKVDVEGFLKQAGLPAIPQNSPAYAEIKRELLKVAQGIEKIEVERSQGNYNSATEANILTVYPEAPQVDQTSKRKPKGRGPAKKPSMAMSDAIQTFINENESDGNWSPATLRDYTDRLNIFCEILGNPALSRIDYKKIRQGFDDLKRLPPNRTKVEAYRDKTVKQLLRLDLPPEKCLGANRINNTMSTVGAFFKWCIKLGHLDRNHADGMRVKRTQRAAEDRPCFERQEIELVFSALGKKDNHHYWVPKIALFTGMRLEETCQLHLEDVRQEKGVWVFDVNAEGTKRLKNLASKRLVPIHRTLIDDGILDYYEKVKSAGHERLFPELSLLKGRYGEYLSRRFSSLLTKLRIKTPGKKTTFHSLRHTFINRCYQLDLNPTHIKLIVGHADGSVHGGTYVKGQKLVKNLRETIDQVHFDLGVK